MLEWIILGWCCLGVSVILVIAGIVVWAISHRRNMQWEEPQMAKPAADGENAPDDTTPKRDRRRLQRRGNFFNKPRRRHMVAPFYKFLAFFFFGAAVSCSLIENHALSQNRAASRTPYAIL